MSQIIDPVEVLWELRQHVDNLSDYNHTEFHPLSVSAEGFNDKFECNFLQRAINNLILDDCTVKFGDLL